jgi:hypothetical protein
MAKEILGVLLGFCRIPRKEKERRRLEELELIHWILDWMNGLMNEWQRWIGPIRGRGDDGTHCWLGLLTDYWALSGVDSLFVNCNCFFFFHRFAHQGRALVYEQQQMSGAGEGILDGWIIGR